jgi:hypothetical protein
MMTHDEMIAVIAHHRDGGKVEWSYRAQNEWYDDEDPCWGFNSCDYRPKPEPMTIYAEICALKGTLMRTSNERINPVCVNTIIKRFIEAND